MSEAPECSPLASKATMLRSPTKKTLFGWPLLLPDFMQSNSVTELLARLNPSIRVAGLLRNVLAGMASDSAF